MVEQRPSQWSALFDVATNPESFRGRAALQSGLELRRGTALMLQIGHRESHDIDFFLFDPQVLPFLNPETQGFPLVRMPDAYDGDGAGSLKLSFATSVKSTSFCASNITAEPTQHQIIRNRSVALETAAEIIAKKVYFRGASLQPRDMFDIAAVIENLSEDYAVNALRQRGLERCKATLVQVEKRSPISCSTPLAG